jgi:hypothetical protein
MKFKSSRIESEWNDPRLSVMLKQIVEEAEAYARARHDWEFTLTCLMRTPKENDAQYYNDGSHLTGVHVVWRGGDIRTRDVDPSAVQDVTTFINDRHVYDPTRPGMKVALLEGAATGGPHVHIQVSPATKRREPTRAETVVTA